MAGKSQPRRDEGRAAQVRRTSQRHTEGWKKLGIGRKAAGWGGAECWGDGSAVRRGGRSQGGPVGLMGVGGKEQRSFGHGVVDASRNESPIFRHLG